MKVLLFSNYINLKSSFIIFFIFLFINKHSLKNKSNNLWLKLRPSRHEWHDLPSVRKSSRLMDFLLCIYVNFFQFFVCRIFGFVSVHIYWHHSSNIINGIEVGWQNTPLHYKGNLSLNHERFVVSPLCRIKLSSLPNVQAILLRCFWS